MRILERHANLQAAELKEIWRQKADSHKAVIADLRAGNLERAFKRLDELGMLRELAPEKRHEALAADYASGVKEGKSALVISPTHVEGERVTARIRERLKEVAKLGHEDREFLQPGTAMDRSATGRCPQLPEHGSSSSIRTSPLSARGTSHRKRTGGNWSDFGQRKAVKLRFSRWTMPPDSKCTKQKRLRWLRGR